MKQFSKTLILLLTILAFNASAQVKFKLVFDEINQHYVFSIISEVTYESPANITGTGQMTIKVPSGAFEVTNVVNLHQDMIWTPNSRSDSPEENQEFDYISFGLASMGAALLDYKAGEEIPVFTFQNALGCTGAISLIDNELDPFLPPNSRRANVGNQLTIFGAKGNAYLSNAIEDVADCTASPIIVTEGEELSETAEISIFPNPTVDRLNITVKWTKSNENALVKIVDGTGRIVLSNPLTLNKGKNTYQINVSHLPAGSYFINLSGKGLKKKVERFIKIEGVSSLQ